MVKKILAYTKEIMILIVKKVLIFDLLIIILVGLSFLFLGEFSLSAFSDRLFWVGLLIMMAGGVMALGQTSGGRDFGPMLITSAQASLLTDFNIEVRQDVEKKFTPIIRVFVIGLVCFLVGILVSVISGALS